MSYPGKIAWIFGIKTNRLNPRLSDSPFKKAHSLSVLLKSPDVKRFQSKLIPCKNSNCKACETRKRRTSYRWKQWKILSKDANPCETN